MDNIYFIHDDRNIGREELVRPFKDVFGGKFIEPNENFNITLEKIINDFSLNSIADNLIIFSDNMIIHKKFNMRWKQIKKFIERSQKWDIIFLDNNDENDKDSSFKLIPFDSTIDKYSMGIIINRDSLMKIMEYIHRPFDMIIKRLKCLKCSKSIIKNNTYELEGFHIRKKINMFILATSNYSKLKLFIDKIRELQPIVRPFYIFIEPINDHIIELLDNSNSKYFMTGSLAEIIKKYHIKGKSYFIVTNIYVSWNSTMPNIFPVIEMLMENNNCIFVPLKNDKSEEFYKNFSIFNNRIDTNNKYILKLPFYNNRFNLEKDNYDFIDDIKSMKPHLLLGESLIKKDIFTWLSSFDVWKKNNNYSRDNIIKLLGYDRLLFIEKLNKVKI